MGMVVAEHVTATAAVVTTLEKTERLLADRSVADYGVRVGLPVLFRRRSFDFGEINFLYHLLFRDVIRALLFLAVSSWPSTECLRDAV